MEYLLLFLEGVITFISPCILPLLPIYLSYFAGQELNPPKTKTLTNALGFILGFTLVFVVLGAFAGTVGSYLRVYSQEVNFVCGILVVLLGLNYMGILRIPFPTLNHQPNLKINSLGFFSSLLFGLVFSLSWTPCVGAFLGSALMLAATEGESIKGILMLLCFSLGLGIPFVVCALLIERLKSSLDFIKKNYNVITILSGGFLVLVGILMATGLLGYLLSLLTF